MIKYACVNTRKSRASIPEKLEIRKSQDLAKDFGGTASKAEKEICKSKMKTKRKKKKKEAKRKKLYAKPNPGPSTYRAKGFTTRPRGTHKQFERNFIIKTFKPPVQALLT